ncbi:CAP domain-containing protein [Lujinxingia vulgaris]|uniref:CAP domain-containing protein n=1 Tax=Lujinxingia vulgaris TaxID=2600176 RepID=UPI001E3D8374|nr:CAP domain-containing protein [Lujinxingia vulgaris]
MPRPTSHRTLITPLALCALLLAMACSDDDGPRRGIPTGDDVGSIFDSGNDAGDANGVEDAEDPADASDTEDPTDATDTEDAEDPADTGDVADPDDADDPADVEDVGDDVEDSDDVDDAGDPDHPAWTTAEAFELYELIMAYRAENGLPELPLSPSLSAVAAAHVDDLNAHPETTDGECNLHSWSDQGSWTACCYTPDHAEASCMWDKPRELSDYPGDGYEISAMSTFMAPDNALRLWQNSPGHNAVILNEGSWSTPWGAIGVGIAGQYAHVWFGREADPAL